MSWDKPAPSLTARFDSFTRGKFAHPSDNRSITLREGARIQTFPDDFGFEGTQEEIASQIGNAIPPRLAMVLGRALLEALERRVQIGENTAKHKQLVLIR
jgi:DNA (cytosine-5)-methyltransferase 1